MKSIVSRFHIVYLILTFVLLSGCEPTETMTIRNNTNERLTAVVNGSVSTIEPNTQIEKVVEVTDYSIEVKGASGTMYYKEKFTFEEMRWLDWKILIPASRK